MKKNSVVLYILVALALVIAIIALFKGNKKTGVSNVVLKEENGTLMWKYDSDSSWNNLYNLSILKGVDGINGKDGVNGVDGKNGTNGKNGTDGKDGRDGIDGHDGVDGRTVELRVDGTMIQWKYTDEEEWTDLIDVSSVGGGGSGNNDTPTNPEDAIVTAVNGDSEDLGCYIKGTSCQNGTLMTVKVNNSTTVDFYVMNDDGDNITLIAASNIGDNSTTTVAWYSSSSGNTSYGPLTVLSSLNTVTSEWTNISAIYHYAYTNSGTGYKSISIDEGVATITDAEDGTTTVEGVSRARLLTYEEAYNFGCRASANQNCPAWLYGNMDGTNYSLRPYGYWLLTSTSNIKNAYNMRNTSALASNSASDTSGRGIRPVITIKKITGN